MDTMTLVEYAKGLENDNVAKPFIMAFAMSSDVMQVLPFSGMNGAAYEYYRATQLADPGFRAINEPSTSGQGVISPFQEASYVIDHDLDVDRAIVDRHGPTRRARQETLLMASAGELWTNTFFAGDNTTNPREFNGIQKRATLHSADRVLHNSVASGGAALSLYNLDRAIMNTWRPTHIIMSRDMIPRIMQAARTPAVSGNIFQTWDEAGTRKMSYGGIPILTGYDKTLNTGILPFTEVGNGGGSAVTGSIYVAHIGEDGLHGLQIKAMDFRDFGLLQDGITYRTHFSWDVGLVDEHPFCLTRLDSITNAAFVA